jgi:7-carboxy-7-deazaguanine synthase
VRDLLVSEVFGPTFQGEGAHTGRRAAFVRLGTCNLHCNWCDTPYTWAFDKRHAEMHHTKKQYDPKKELVRRSADSIYAELSTILPSGGCVVLTGGEPMLQQGLWWPLVDQLLTTGKYCVEVETAGTIQPDADWWVDYVHWNVSPKLAHSGNELDLRYRPEVLKALAGHCHVLFKFVVQNKADFSEIEYICHQCGIERSQVWIMPEGINATGQLKSMKEIASETLMRGFNLSPRLHVLLWDDERGR